MVRSSMPGSSTPPRTGLWRRWVDSALSLQCKATVLLIVLTLTPAAAVSGYLLYHSGRLAREQDHARLAEAAAMLTRAAAVTLASGDGEGLATLVADAVNGRPLLYVVVTDLDGRELASAESRHFQALQHLKRGGSTTGRYAGSTPGAPAFAKNADEARVLIEVTYPIALRTKVEGSATSRPAKLLGYVRTGMMSNHWERSMSSQFDLMIGVGLIATVGVIPLGFFMVRRVVAPVESLADTMMRCAQGNLSVRSEVNRRDEIGSLARAFNRMADQHQQTHERIVRLNAELEERVTFRTQQLRELASRDPLTGLFNRRYFNEVLERRFSEAMRYESDLTCIMLDLDEFKAANDAFGHHVGDELLVLTSATILSQLRNADVAARYGGDEFIVLLPQTDAEQAHTLAERIVLKFTRDALQRFPKVAVAMSLGIASLHGLQNKDAESLIRAADHAMYDAKAAGKRRIVVSSAISSPAPA